MKKLSLYLGQTKLNLLLKKLYGVLVTSLLPKMQSVLVIKLLVQLRVIAAIIAQALTGYVIH